MSKARNIADLLDANGDVALGNLDNVPPSNDASALTTGTLSADRLPSEIVSSDTSPQLGGDLDGNGNNIYTTGSGTFTVGSTSGLGGVNVYKNGISTTHSNPHMFLSNKSNTTGDKALIHTGFSTDGGAGFTPVSFGGLNVDSSNGVRDGAFVVYVADNDNVDLATDERMRVTESGLSVTGDLSVSGSITADVGKILQVQEMTRTASFSQYSSSYVDAGMGIAITPKSTSSKILVFCNINGIYMRAGNTSGYINVKIVRIVGGTTSNCTGANANFHTEIGRNSSVGDHDSVSLQILDEPATTSQIVYQLQFVTLNNDAKFYYNDTSGTSSMIAMEVAG